jgi:hypothetical protein
MTSLNRSIERVTSTRGIVGVLFVACVISGVLFTSAASLGQAVPPRVQALQMTRPVAPPPEPPVQKEIRQLRQEMRARDRELARRQALVEIREFKNRRVEELKKLLSCYEDHLLGVPIPTDRKICGWPLPDEVRNAQDLTNYCADRVQSIKKQIEGMEYGVSK